MNDRRPSEKYAVLIGRIAAYWSLTEYMCDQALAVFIGVAPNVARSMTPVGAKFAARLEILKSVSAEALEDSEMRREFESLLEGLLTASIERDAVIHSVWFNLGYEDATETTYQFQPGETPISRSRKYRHESLQQVLDQIREATEALTSFLLTRLDMPASTPSIKITVL